MSLTPICRDAGRVNVFPVKIAHSALLESGYSSTGTVATNCTIALGFKPTAATTTPLTDMSGHYLLTIQKVGGTVRVWKQGVELANYTGSVGATYAEFLSNVLNAYSGSNKGYYSRLVIVEAVKAYSDFWEPSDLVTGLWVPKSLNGLTPYTHLHFGNAVDLGADISGNGNNWIVAGSQSDDTPTDNITTRTWPEPTILKSSTAADLVARAGNSEGSSVVLQDMEGGPDFINEKNRDGANSWALYDKLRGDYQVMHTNTTHAPYEWLDTTAFTSTGYQLGTAGNNIVGNNYLDLCLKAGVDQGFAILTASHTTGTATVIPHGLGKKPSFIIEKPTNLVYDWFVWHQGIGWDKRLVLNSTAVSVASASPNPTSTNVEIPAGMPTGTYVLYVWTDSDIFKAFSYTGNGSTDGPFVNLGGKPLSIPFLKNTNAAVTWTNIDAVRDPLNPVGSVLQPDTNSVELVGTGYRFSSTGVKIANTGPSTNGSGNLHVGLAILESTKYSNAF